MNISSQLSLLPKSNLNAFKTLKHGGKTIKGKRKTKRPLFKSKNLHLVLKSSRAFGKLSLFRFDSEIKILLRRYSRSNFFEILNYVNMGNHLHLHLKPHDVKSFKNFLKAFSGTIARLITKAKKGNPFGKFWDTLVYSRVLTTNYEALSLKGYFNANRIEKLKNYNQREIYWRDFKLKLNRLKKSVALVGPFHNLSQIEKD